MAVSGCSKIPGHDHGRQATPGGEANEQGHGHGNPADLQSYLARLEDPERAEWQKPDKVVAALAVEPGSVACDIGAGPGYFSLRLAKAVGERGTVYAVDVDPQILAVLRDRIAEAGARNVTPVLGLSADSLVPRSACDLILIVNTLHHFPEPVAYLKALQHRLKVGGRLVNIDFHKRPTPVGPPLESRIDREGFLAMAKEAGFEVTREHELLPHQYFVELVHR